MLRAKTKIFKPSPQILIGYFGLLLFILSPNKFEYPATVICIITFAFAHLAWPEARFKYKHGLCPLNISQLLLFSHILAFPIIGVLLGYSRGSLPWLPSNFAINISLLLSAIAYMAFCGSYNYFEKRIMNSPTPAFYFVLKKPYYSFKSMHIVGIIYLTIGFFGFYLFFDTVNAYKYYLSYPSYVFSILNDLSGTIRGAASNFLRPFLAIGFILFWSLWIDGGKLLGEARLKVL